MRATSHSLRANQVLTDVANQRVECTPGQILKREVIKKANLIKILHTRLEALGVVTVRGSEWQMSPAN